MALCKAVFDIEVETDNTDADPGTRTRRSATFLPEVAHSEGWGLYETIEHLVLKAGFNGHTEDVLTALEVQIASLYDYILG